MDFETYTQQIMDRLSESEKLAFIQLQSNECWIGFLSRDYLLDSELIKTNRNVAEWFVFSDGSFLEYVGQFRDDPDLVRIATQESISSVSFIGAKLADDGEFVKALIKEFPKAAYEVFKNASLAVQLDPEVAQIYLENRLIGEPGLPIRQGERGRREARNCFPPEVESRLDYLLDRYDHFKATLDLCSAYVFTAMRAERMPAMKQGSEKVELPTFEW